MQKHNVCPKWDQETQFFILLYLLLYRFQPLLVALPATKLSAFLSFRSQLKFLTVSISQKVLMCCYLVSNLTISIRTAVSDWLIHDKFSDRHLAYRSSLKFELRYECTEQSLAFLYCESIPILFHTRLHFPLRRDMSLSQIRWDPSDEKDFEEVGRGRSVYVRAFVEVTIFT